VIGGAGIVSHARSSSPKHPPTVAWRCRSREKAFSRGAPFARPVRRPHYEKVQDLLSPEDFDAKLAATVAAWGGLLDRDAAAMVVVEGLGRPVASFTRIADLEEGAEASVRAQVVSLSPVREFARQDGSQGRVVNLELRDASGFCRFPLWDEDVEIVERGKIRVGSNVRALDCYVKRTSFGLELTKGKFGSLLVEG